jgi:hypothetical protein
VDDLKIALGLGILGYLAGWVLGRLARNAFRALMLAALVWFALVCLGFSLQLPSWEYIWTGLFARGHHMEPQAQALWGVVRAHLPLALGLLIGLLRGLRGRRR